MKDDKEKIADNRFLKGTKDLKTSYFSFKFSPDYLSAVANFENAGNLYEDCNLYDKAIQSYLKSIECNKKLLESWAEAKNYLRIAEIYFLGKNDIEKGFKYLDEAQISFKIAGKYHTSLKIMIDLSQKLQEYSVQNQITKYNQISVQVLEGAWNDALDNQEDELIRISLDSLYSKLFDNYLIENDMNLEKAVKLTTIHLNILLKTKNVKIHKIVNCYAKLVMLNLISQNFEKSENLIENARKSVGHSSSEDISDMSALVSNYKDKNQKKINYLITYSYHLFERNLIKMFKKSFDNYMSMGTKSDHFLGDEDKKVDVKIEIGNELITNNEDDLKENPDDFL